MYSSNLGPDMFPSNSLSDLHLEYTKNTLVTGRSSSPFDPTLYDLLDDDLIFEQLLFHEEQETEARDDGEINLTGSCNTSVETTSSIETAMLPVSLDRSSQSKDHPVKKTSSKVAGSRKLQLMPRKRTGKKDRHSKIRTAQGLRDRRIRLSVNIARKFFDLQDMLDLDKASKTIEWLLAKSQDAIDELSQQNSRNLLNMDTMPERTMASSIKEAEEEEEQGQQHGRRKKRKVCNGKITCMKRVLRNKARARARERTREKLMMKGLNLEDSEQVHEKGNLNYTSLDGGFLGQPENGRDSDHSGDKEMNTLNIIKKFHGFTSTTNKPGSVPDISLGNDCNEMIGGVNLLEGNVQEFADGDSSMFMASLRSSQGNPSSFSPNIPGHNRPKYASSVLGSTPSVQNQ